MLRFLRRIAILALVLAGLLWAVPRLLVRAGVLGPTAAQEIDEAAAAIATARAYGSTGGDALATAERRLAEARALAAGGDERDARRVASAATASAIDAQKAALVARTEMHQRAELVYKDLDRRINDLEKLYEKTTPGLEKARTDELLSRMKVTRQAAGAVFLAYEQKDYGAVMAGEDRARAVIEGTRSALQSAGALP